MRIFVHRNPFRLRKLAAAKIARVKRAPHACMRRNLLAEGITQACCTERNTRPLDFCSGPSAAHQSAYQQAQRRGPDQYHCYQCQFWVHLADRTIVLGLLVGPCLCAIAVCWVARTTTKRQHSPYSSAAPQLTKSRLRALCATDVSVLAAVPRCLRERQLSRA
jgi:hypothetical protein